MNGRTYADFVASWLPIPIAVTRTRTVRAHTHIETRIIRFSSPNGQELIEFRPRRILCKSSTNACDATDWRWLWLFVTTATNKKKKKRHDHANVRCAPCLLRCDAEKPAAVYLPPVCKLRLVTRPGLCK